MYLLNGKIVGGKTVSDAVTHLGMDFWDKLWQAFPEETEVFVFNEDTLSVQLCGTPENVTVEPKGRMEIVFEGTTLVFDYEVEATANRVVFL